MEELIERIEALDGPDRATFVSAWEAIHGAVSRSLRYNPSFARFIELIDAEAWLDAAMTLVPEGRFFEIGPDSIGGKRWVSAILYEGSATWTDEDTDSEAATPALALCAAALKARSAALRALAKEE